MTWAVPVLSLNRGPLDKAVILGPLAYLSCLPASEADHMCVKYFIPFSDYAVSLHQELFSYCSRAQCAVLPHQSYRC